MTRVLFVCVQNSARSQMAEALANHLCGSEMQASSAGLEPGALNPLAVEAMREIGVEISARPTQSVFDLLRSGELFSYVITVCDESSAERCPIFAGITKRLHWSLADPGAFEGTQEKKLAKTRLVRDEIRGKIEELCRSLRQTANPTHS